MKMTKVYSPTGVKYPAPKPATAKFKALPPPPLRATTEGASIAVNILENQQKINVNEAAPKLSPRDPHQKVKANKSTARVTESVSFVAGRQSSVFAGVRKDQQTTKEPLKLCAQFVSQFMAKHVAGGSQKGRRG